MTLLQLQASFSSPDSPAPQTVGGGARIRVDAYTGGAMYVPPQGWILIELTGLELSPQVPLVSGHKTAVEATVGFGSPEADAGHLIVTGKVFDGSPLGQQIIGAAKSGFRWQASVGVEILEAEPIPPRQTIRANGQTIVTPPEGLLFVRRGRLREVTICAAGCDPQTSVSIAASLGKNPTMPPDTTAPTDMATENPAPKFEDWVASLGFDPATLTEPQKKGLRDVFDTKFATTNPDAATAPNSVNAQWGQNPYIAAQNAQRRRELEAAHVRNLEANAPTWAGTRGTETDTPQQAGIIEASLCLSAGVNADRLANWYGQRVVNAAMSREHRGATIRTAMEFCMAQAGQRSRDNRMSDAFIRAAFESDRMIRATAGFSTMSLSGILGNVSGKMMLDAYQSTPTTWQNFCGTTDAKDFKAFKRFRLIGKGVFSQVPKSGELKHIRLDEQEYENQLEQYGAMIAITRPDIINDDLGALNQTPRIIGRLSAIRLEKEIYSLLMSNPDNFFSVENDNLLTGGGSVLAIAGLTAAEQQFLERLDPNGDPLMVVPEMLMVPPALSVTANSLTRDTQIIATGIDSTAAITTSGNPHAGRFRPIVPPWLSNENLSGNSSAAWYLFADPAKGVAAMEVGFLNGQQYPTIESGDTDFNTLGMQWRGVFDFGVAMQDPRAALKSAGA